MHKVYCLFLALFSATALCRAQSLRLLLQPEEAKQAAAALNSFKPKPENIAADTLFLPVFSDSIGRRMLRHLQEQSYLSASIDSLVRIDSAHLSARLYLGPSMQWLQLRTSPADRDWLQASGFRPRLFEGKALHPDAAIRLKEALLQQAENNGYPFATVRLDSFELNPEGGASGRLVLERNRYVRFAGIKMNGNVKLPKAYLPAYLGIRPGEAFSAARVLQARERLRELPFLESSANPLVRFAGNEATVNLFLKEKKASRFDFVLGLLPQTNAADGRLLVTGTLNATFQNALSLGEHFSIEIERLKPENQQLKAAAGIPYLFGLPLGADGRLNVYRRDSSWVDANAELGIQYFFEGGTYLKLLWENRSSILQSVDTLAVLQTRRLPANPDLRQNAYGLEAAFSRLDYRFNPRSGWLINVRGLAGFHSLQRNTRIESLRDPADPAFDFGSLYDTTTLRATRWRAELTAEAYLPLFQRSTLKAALRTNGIFSDKPVYNNEQYRLGGNRLLRGFNEQSLFATRYAIATLEYRLLIGPNSFLGVFTDYGYLENITNRTRAFQRPWGLGAGLNFETKAGIFGISVAVGRPDAGLPFDFRATKFHLGYVSVF